MSLNDYDKPTYDRKVEIPCRHCTGDDDDCPDCSGSGVESISRGEARNEWEQEKYDDYYDRDTRGE